jgi:hypothetical protein
MKLRLIIRGAFFLFLYMALFFALASAQFMRQAQFTRRVGNFSVSGLSREAAEGEQRPGAGEYFIDGSARVTYGGLDFVLSNGEKQLLIVDSEGNHMPLSAGALSVSSDTAHFMLSDGAELVFYTQKSPNNDGLIISGVLPEKAASLRIPFELAPTSRAVDRDGRWTLLSGDVNYRFDRDTLEGAYLVLSRENPMVFYSAVAEAQSQIFSHVDFIVRGAMEKSVYDEAEKRWLSGLYAVWEIAVPGTSDETLVTAFLAEAARRGAYTSALQLVPESFRASVNAAYLSSPYLGRLSNALRALSADVRAEAAHFSAQLRETPRILLSGTHVFKYWTLAENKNLIEERGLYARSVDPMTLRFDETAGVVEGWNDWAAYSPNSENPFGKLMPAALELVAAKLKRDAETDLVFAYNDGRADTLYNFRLGLSLAAYGETAQDAGWAGIGRSLAISVFALTENGELPSYLVDNEAPVAGEVPAESDDAEAGLQATALYPVLAPSPYHPWAADLSGVQNGLWMWTAARDVRGTFQNNILDIAVTFPVGWTHYLLVRGVSPFQKIQLRDVDFRSDPRFEQYSSHGWAYSTSEQTLLVKIVQRTESEHIKIFY